MSLKKRKRHRRGSFSDEINDEYFASDSNFNDDSDNHCHQIVGSDIHDAYHVCDDYTDNSEVQDCDNLSDQDSCEVQVK